MAVVLHIYPPGGSIGQNVCCGGSTEIIKTLIFVHFEVRNTYSIIIIILLIYCYYYYFIIIGFNFVFSLKYVSVC